MKKVTEYLVTAAFFGLVVALFLLFSQQAHGQMFSPFGALGNAQFMDNNGKPLVAGVLYSYQAGTTTLQATYTDSTGTVLNPNPLPFGSGARVGIWLTTGSFYKFILCLQNDGPSCAPADVLFSVDQVPGGASSSGGSSGPPFITNSANPATTGIVRLASGDTICYRNAANNANLCISKDSNDVLSWAGGAIKLPEIPCANSGAGFDYLCPSSTNHRFMQAPNGGAQAQIVDAGVDINTSDQVTQLHFGATPTPLSSTAPGLATPYVQWNGTNLVGGGAVGCNNLTAATVGNSTSGNLQSCVILANTMQAGSEIHYALGGLMGSTANPTLTATIAFGGQTLCSVQIAGIAGANNQVWYATGSIVVLSAGSSGSLSGGCTWFGTPESGGGGGATSAYIANYSLPVTVNTTVNDTLQISVTWSAANANNTITEQYLKAAIW